MGRMNQTKPVRASRKGEQRTTTSRVRAIAQSHDADAILAAIAREAEISLANLPSARVGYLAALLRAGTHKRALAAARMDNVEYNRHFQDQRFRKMIRGVRAILDDVRRDVIHDLVFERSGKSDRVLMFAAERLDPRYTPPNVAARQGNTANIQAVQINVLLPDGRPAGDHANMAIKNPSKNDGFFERLLGSEPTHTHTDADEPTEPTGADEPDATEPTDAEGD